jgi:hypothetical protein
VIPRERFCNKLNALSFQFQRQADRVMIYRRPRDRLRVSVPRRELLDEDYVRATLALCGCQPEEIEIFVAGNRCAS